MIFPIDNVDPKHQVIVYENIPDLIQRVKWQDIFELIFILFYKNATEFGWSYIPKNVIGTVHDRTIIAISRVSKLVTECLGRIKSKKNISEFNF